MTAPGTTPIPATGWWVKRSIKAFPTPAALVLTAGTPTLRLGTAVTPAAAALVLTVSSPVVRQGLQLTPAAASMLLTGSTPTLRNTALLTPAGVSMVLTGSTPVLATTLRPGGAAMTLTGSAPSLIPPPITDDFNRADSTTSLGANWTNRVNAVGINGNAAYATNQFVINEATHNTTMGSNDMQVDITLGSIQGSDGPVRILLGYNSSGEGAYVVLVAGAAATTRIFSVTSGWTGGTVQATASAAPTFTAGDVWTFKRVGNVYTVLKNSVAVAGLSWTDSGNIVPRDSSHRLVGIGVDGGGSGSYRRIDSFTATSL